MARKPEASIMRILRTRPSQTTAELADRVAWTRNTTFNARQHSLDTLRVLQRMERQGLVARQPNTRPIQWKKGGQQ